MKAKLIHSLTLSLALLVVFSSCATRPAPAKINPIPVQPLNIVNTAVQVESAPVAARGSLSELDLTIKQTFAVTRPLEKITVTSSTYFITGTSSPTSPVYLDGKEIVRIGTLGTFGVHVQLQLGNNTFTLNQGDNSQTVTIKRENSVAKPINAILQSSMVPSVSWGLSANEQLKASCIAPAGSTVTATFNGQTATLKQVATDKSNGSPVVFSGMISTTPPTDPNITEKSGQVVYTLTYNGTTKKFTSTGFVYLAGENSRIALQVNKYAGFVYNSLDPATMDISHVLKGGALETLKSQDNNYFQLSNGGYITKETVSILEGDSNVASELKKVTFTSSKKQEQYVFAATKTSAAYCEIGNGTFIVTLPNTKGTPNINVASSNLFESVTATTGENSVTYTFVVKNFPNLWGHNIAYDGTNIILTLRYKPTLSTDTAKPFTGLKIMLDPGHGGTDPGAAGVAGKNGPTESTLNLAHAYATRDLLEQMGATVILTRPQDNYVSLDDRCEAIEKSNIDLFLSIHHNSIGYDSDANLIMGMEMYYHNALSKKFANATVSQLTTAMERKNRGIKQSYYRVTLMPFAPSIMAELGFVSNPIDYEKATSTAQLQKMAQGVVAAIKQTLG